MTEFRSRTIIAERTVLSTASTSNRTDQNINDQLPHSILSNNLTKSLDSDNRSTIELPWGALARRSTINTPIEVSFLDSITVHVKMWVITRFNSHFTTWADHRIDENNTADTVNGKRLNPSYALLETYARCCRCPELQNLGPLKLVDFLVSFIHKKFWAGVNTCLELFTYRLPYISASCSLKVLIICVRLHDDKEKKIPWTLYVTIENTIISLLLNFSLDNWDLHKEMMDLLDQPKPNQDKQFEQIEATFTPIEIPDSIRTIPNKMSPEARIKKLQWVQRKLPCVWRTTGLRF